MKIGEASSSECGQRSLISDSYRELNRKLHEDVEAYGSTGGKYVAVISALCDEFQTQDILDYGCGKRTLEQALGIQIANYDPAVEGLDDIPEPHDIVVCGDVLEHIEPDCIDSVLADLRRVTRKVAFMTIDQRPAQKTLADGRNAHLIQEDQRWWLPRLLAAGFHIRSFSDSGNRIKLTAT